MKILSEGKFRNFQGFQHMGDKETVVLIFKGTKIECTEDHRFLKIDGEWIEAKDFIKGDVCNGYEFVELIRTHDIRPVYDAIEVEETHSFYAEGLIAHNCSFLYIDETAFLENWDEFFTSVYPTISSGKTTKILLTSTPNGLNHFWKICKGAQEKKNGYIYIEVKWDRVPGRDEAWKEDTLAGMNYDYEKFSQEFEVGWLGSSGTLISGKKLKELDYSEPLMYSEGLSQYKRAEPDRVYVLIADVSRGKGLDYSAFSIIDITEMPYQQVCTYRENFIGPVDYASLIYRICKMYNEPYVLIEINDTGGQVADVLFLDFGYENLIFTESAGRSGKRVSGGFGKNVDRGIRTTKSVKSMGCSILKMLVEQDQLYICDFNTIQELSRFSKKGSSYEAESGAHDDLVMGLVLFSWLTDQTYFRDLTDINTLARLREKTDEELENSLLPFGFIINGGEDDYEEPVVRYSDW